MAWIMSCLINRGSSYVLYFTVINNNAAALCLFGITMSKQSVFMGYSEAGGCGFRELKGGGVMEFLNV